LVNLFLTADRWLTITGPRLNNIKGVPTPAAASEYLKIKLPHLKLKRERLQEISIAVLVFRTIAKRRILPPVPDIPSRPACRIIHTAVALILHHALPVADRTSVETVIKLFTFFFLIHCLASF